MKINKAQRILVSLVMELNYVNGVALPLANLVLNDPVSIDKQPTQAEPLYEGTKYQVLDIVDNLIFGKAEAAFYENVGTRKDTVIVSGQSVGAGLGNSGGNTQTIYAGGTVSGGIHNIIAGGTQIISSGGYAYGNNNIHSGGTQIVYTGGMVSNLDVFQDGFSDVNGGQVKWLWVSSGGTQFVHHGGAILTPEGTQQNYVLGYQSVYDGGAVNKVYVSAGGTQVVGAGGTALGAGATVQTLGLQQLVSGGSADSMIVIGKQEILGGTATNTTVHNNGVQSIASSNGFSGQATNTIISAGGKQEVSAGGTALHNSIYGTQTLYDGGNIGTDNVIYNGGTQNISGGVADQVIVQAGGIQNVQGGTATNAAISGTQNVSTGYASNNTVSIGGKQNVSGGLAESNTIHGSQTIYAGSAKDTTVSTGGEQTISGGVANINLINAGGLQVISSGTAIATTVFTGGVQKLTETTAVAKNTYISGGQSYVQAGSASDTYIYADGTQTVEGTGSAYNVFISNGGTSLVDNGGKAERIKINAGGQQLVNTGGSAHNIDVFTGGIQTVDGGKATHIFVYTGGTQNINNGGTTFNVDVKGGVQNVEGGTASYVYVSSGAVQNISGGQATSNTLSGVQNIYAGVVKLTTIVSGGKQEQNGGTNDGATVEAGGLQNIYAGTVTNNVVTGGEMAVYNTGIAISDVTMSDGLMRLGADSGDYNISGTFNFTGGVVDMISHPDKHTPNPRTYETLTIANLVGQNGTCKLDTDLNSAVYGSETTNGDKIILNAGTPSVNGTYYVQVADESLYTGLEITGERKLLLITDNSGQNFSMIGKDLNNGGLWVTHAPDLFREGNKWYLGYIEKEPNTDTTVTLSDRQVAVYNQWTRVANDSLRKRLGDLRYNEAEAGLWVRYNNGKLAGSGYEQRYHTYQIGMDKTNGHSTYGLAFEGQETSQNYTYGSGEGTTNIGNIYYSHYTDSGSYFDTIFTYGKINSKYLTTGDYPDGAEYKTPAYSLSVEYGKTNNYKAGYFFEPKVQLTYGSISAANYFTNRGTRVEESGIRSLIGKVGFVAGRKIAQDSSYYMKAGWFKEFKGERNVRLYAANGEFMPKSENYGDSWFEIGLGGNVKIARKTHLYGDIERSLGADMQKQWQINAGIRWEF